MKEMVKKETGNEMMNTESLEAWGSVELTQNDIIIPKILAMQGLSDLVAQGKAVFGDFCNSLTGKKLGGINKPIELIPFYMERLWLVFEPNEKGKMKFKELYPITHKNENLEWSVKNEKGVEILRRDRTLQFYVLLPEDIKRGLVFPYVVSFRRTSAKAGKKLATQMYVINRQMNLAPAGKTVRLHGTKESNDDGTFIVMDITEGRKTTQEELASAFDMYRMILQGANKVDHSDIQSEELPKQGEVSDEF